MCYTLLFLLLISTLNIQYVSSLCSSKAYSNKMRQILSQQTDYDVYEGKLIFMINASDPIGTNPSGVYGVPYFTQEEIYNQHSISKYSYFLRSSDALIFSGCTPPKSIYFSFVSYVLDRFNFYENGTFQIGSRKMLYASLGASLNNLVWNTTNATNNYDSLTTVLQTGDNQTWNDIYNLLTNNNINQEINLQSLPNEYCSFVPYKYNNTNIKQYNLTHDTGTILLRITLTDNKQEYEEYIHQNQTLFMLQPKMKMIKNQSSNQPNQAFQALRRNTYSPQNVNETTTYSNILSEYEMDLINYLCTTYNMTYDSTIIMANNAKIWHGTDYGFSCIEYNINCAGDNRDAQYWQANLNATVAYDTMFIILGVMQTNLKQTLYSNIVYYDHGLRPFIGLSPTITDTEYNGSGLILPVNTHIDKQYLQNIYVVQLTRNYHCIDELPGFCLDTFPVSVYGDVMVRNYLNPITHTRPDQTEIIPPMLIKFKTNQP